MSSEALDKKNVEHHFDEVAVDYDYWKKKNAYYYNNIKAFLRRQIAPNSRVLEIGCGTGELLASVEPSFGVGVDISEKMVGHAQEKYPDLKFIHSAVEDLEIDEKFDYIIMVDVVDHVYDVMEVFKSVRKFCVPTTKVILTTINPWWDPVLTLCEKYGLKMPEGPHNFIELGHLKQMAEYMNFSVNFSGFMLLFPKYIPLLSFLANSLGVRIWGINRFSSVQYMVLQPKEEIRTDLGYGCTVVMPCHNEEGNVENGIRRIPQMGKETEIIIVNDGSTDNTAGKVKELQEQYPNVRLIDYSPNRGKGEAVRAGFEAATQEIVMILDADLTTMPEELPHFFNLLNKGQCDFVNGTRLVYPMQDQAMRFLNLLGNKFFGFLLTFIVQQRLTDTLCGTKAMYKRDVSRIQWGKDKWGDFDLLFGAAKIGCRMLEVPVHYQSRVSGESKMKSFTHGLHLIKACIRGFSELVFVPQEDKKSHS